jgi:hypothetical protein
MKKPFKQTRLGKFLRGVVREIPLIGGLRDHVVSKQFRASKRRAGEHHSTTNFRKPSGKASKHLERPQRF